MSGSQDKVRSLLVPLKGRNLLIPNIAIAELIPYKPLGPAEDAPDWLMGILAWRGHELPVISFEALRGDPRPEPGEQAHIAVMNSVKGEDGAPFYALATQGIPHLRHFGDEDVQASAASGSPAGEAELAHVQIEAEQAVIPDLDALESLAAKYVA